MKINLFLMNMLVHKNRIMSDFIQVQGLFLYYLTLEAIIQTFQR